MFLIEYDNGLFVNASSISWVDVKSDSSRFTLKGESNNIYIVGADHCERFFNNLQALNDNITNIESCWHKARKKEVECSQPLTQ